MTQPTQPALLNQEKFNAIAGAFARLQMLADKSIDAGPGDNTADEKEQLINYLATELMAHAGEFLGSWQLCNLEYLPALRSLKAIAARCGYHPAAPHNPVNPQHN